MTAVFDGVPKFLLIKNTFDNRWATPKGHLEEGETSEEAAIREIREETGVESKIVELLGQNKYVFRFRDKLIRKKVDIYLLELVGDPELLPEKFDPVDRLVKDVRWFDVDTAVTAIGYKNLRDLIKKGADRAKELYG